MLVKDVMTQRLVTVTPDTGIKGALTKLAFVGVTSLPVVDDQGRLCGILSEADLIGGVADDPRAHERPISIRPVNAPKVVDDVCTRSPIAVRPRDDVTAAVDLMAARGFKSLPVVLAATFAVGESCHVHARRGSGDGSCRVDPTRLEQSRAGWTR